jgi:uncharacterized spore protein YtfJ
MDQPEKPQAPQDLLEPARSLASEAFKEGNVSTVFGAPVKLDDHTVIPIASVSMGGGAGGVRSIGAALDFVRGLFRRRKASMTSPSRALAGGGGFGMEIRPLGFLHEHDGHVVFSQIEAPPRRKP